MFGIFNRFKNTIKNPKILIASIGSDDNQLLSEDRLIYDGYFSDIEIFETRSVHEFYEFIENSKFDILHLFTNITEDNTIQEESGAAFFEHVSQAKIKIFIIASGNDSDRLLDFSSQGKNTGSGMNLVMTLDRKGELFTKFFKSLFGCMLGGKTMPEAWVELAPQNPHIQHETPDTIFLAGAGSLKISA